MDILHSLLYAMIQGVTELFPVSSLGHGILLAHILGWGNDLKSATLLPFFVTLHVGTALALLIYFRKDWLGFLKPNDEHPVFHQKNSRIFISLVAATILPALLGLLFEKKLSRFFGQPKWVAIFLIANGILLLLGAWIQKKKNVHTQQKPLTIKDAILIGLSQALAFLPGISRSGTTLIAGLSLGFEEETAAHFAFLLATPIIFAAAIYEVPKLFKPESIAQLPAALIGGVAAGVCAYLSVSFLMKYFKKSEFTTLLPFGFYCMIIGALSFLIR